MKREAEGPALREPEPPAGGDSRVSPEQRARVQRDRRCRQFPIGVVLRARALKLLGTKKRKLGGSIPSREPEGGGEGAESGVPQLATLG